ncbi:MAG TPA: Asp-tRNA(Asn)/Glu-tRNA(Gln) amidotransferase subunit GatA [Gemmatirosa sp.]|nr:Asp-tRNA(Asn)/Glu-tRNA(Gln) amidotransferase subunit GatA [Gemmatirosa sp.]
MSADALLDLPASTLAEGVRTGRIAPDAGLTASVGAAAKLEAAAINAFVARHESAGAASGAAADVLDAEVRRRRAVARRAGPLAGVPVALKDNLCELGLPTTCGSRILGGYVAPYEATAVSRLLDAGAVVVGKTNMDEFGMGSSTEHSAYGPTRNPIDPSRVPGGSSGGAAAAVAAGVVRIALASDTGGSVRQPAAFCGVVGVKPTYGRVSRHGLVAYASSLDQVGVLARTVDEAALALELIAGRDSFDASSVDVEVPAFRTTHAATADASHSLDGLTVGRPREYFDAALDDGVRERLDAALDALRALGATVKDVELPHVEHALPVYYIVAPAEASSNLARYDGVRFGVRTAGAATTRELYERTRGAGFGPEVVRRILLGTYVLSAGYREAYYRKAQGVRALIAHDFARAFDDVDVLFGPTTPTTAFALGTVADPYAMYANDVFTVTANLVGVPAMSLPVGRSGGLPVGAQLIAPHFGEPVMFRVAAALERALGGEAHA